MHVLQLMSKYIEENKQLLSMVLISSLMEMEIHIKFSKQSGS